MGQQISIFCNYPNKEDRITNYCGLILKMLYNERPSTFEELISKLLIEETDISIGPVFEQQTRENKIIPDLTIKQISFEIYIETKLGEVFPEKQILNYINEIKESNSRIRVLFLLGSFEQDNYELGFTEYSKLANLNGIILKPISFEYLISAIEEVEKSEYLEDLFNDFRAFLDSNGLLPQWKYLLDVVNCAGSINEVKAGFYACPDRGGNYSHSRAKYFGPYKNKEVSEIREIIAVLGVSRNLEEINIRWNNSTQTSESLINTAKDKLNSNPERIAENRETPLLIFLLGEGYETKFIKASKGGALWSKKYFRNIARDVENAKDLAKKLNGKDMDQM